MIRVGQGYDVHAFEEGDVKTVGGVTPGDVTSGGVTLGGVRIPFDKSLNAHSDGDVLIHALCDALLGAAALGDIGRHFPDTDPRYHNISSVELLRDVMAMLEDRGWQFCNGDMTIIAEAPKIAPHVAAMINMLSEAIGCQQVQLNIKATTTEKLGFTGRGEGIACQAIVLLEGDERAG
ncbi:MAG: 2-C-methyl-D-erythritol 2,4-cyclodiphosphate synthase [Porticoccaceae bacterium]|nr:2-C-methyl-D-erythritol 2,4-cyclodiphosphate synthase [Porticoccaceae bacterium]